VLEGASAEPAAQCAVGEHRVESRREILGRAGEETAHPVDDRVEVAGDPGHDGRRGARARLRDRHAPPLTERGRGQHPRPAVELEERVVVEVAGQVQPVAGPGGGDPRLQRRPFVALADDHRLERGMSSLERDEGVDDQLEPLHGHEPAHGDHEWP